MDKRNFMQMISNRWEKKKFVCVGLDSDLEKIPECIKNKGYSTSKTISAFNTAIVDATADTALCYKANIAFYEGRGIFSLQGLIKTVEYIKKTFPEIPVILDAKRADIGNTNSGYVSMAFRIIGVDAITVNPYLGKEALQPFLDQKDKGIIVLCKTSNPGSGEFQDLYVSTDTPLYCFVAQRIFNHWNSNNNCALVVGATYPEELQKVRSLVGDMPILIPAIGKQGGDLEKAVRAGVDSKKQGIIVNSSRGIIFASSEDDFAQKARQETLKLHEEILQYI